MRFVPWLSAVVAGCTGMVEPPPAPEPAAPRFVAITVQPNPMSEPARQDTAFSSVERVGLSSAGDVVVVSKGDVFELGVLGPTRKRLYATAGEPTSLGAVAALEPRASGGAFVAAEHGLFVVDVSAVWRSGWSSGATRAVAERATGPLAGTWVLGDELRLHRDGGVETLSVPGLAMLDGLAVTSDGTTALVTGGGALRVLFESAGALVAEAVVPELEVHNARSPVAGRTLVAATVDEGVVVFDARRVPAWTLVKDVRPLAAAADALSNQLWLRTDTSLLGLDGEVAQALPLETLDGGAALAIDGFGDVLASSSAGLTRFKTGVERVSVGFAADVAPLLERRCVSCHATFRGRAAFLAVAEDALSRVRSHDMPRCENGARCAEPLPASEVKLLEGWIRGGKQP